MFGQNRKETALQSIEQLLSALNVTESQAADVSNKAIEYNVTERARLQIEAIMKESSRLGQFELSAPEQQKLSEMQRAVHRKAEAFGLAV